MESGLELQLGLCSLPLESATLPSGICTLFRLALVTTTPCRLGLGFGLELDPAAKPPLRIRAGSRAATSVLNARLMVGRSVGLGFCATAVMTTKRTSV